MSTSFMSTAMFYGGPFLSYLPARFRSSFAKNVLRWYGEGVGLPVAEVQWRGCQSVAARRPQLNRVAATGAAAHKSVDGERSLHALKLTVAVVVIIQKSLQETKEP
jgi:hypothetical protein